MVFATETLALGINMPARAVVIERMTKFNGERREFLTPAEYTQLTGRAGRRGIDDHGTAIVLWSPFVSFGQIAGLAGSRSFVLRSAFRPTYNMAVNLVRRHDRDAARRLLNQSLAQYQADRAVVVSERRLAKRRQRPRRGAGRRHLRTGRRRRVPRACSRAVAPARAASTARGAARRRCVPGDVIALDGRAPGRGALGRQPLRRADPGQGRSTAPGRRGRRRAWPTSTTRRWCSARSSCPSRYLPDDSDFRAQVASRLARVRTVPLDEHAVAEAAAVDRPSGRRLPRCRGPRAGARPGRAAAAARSTSSPGASSAQTGTLGVQFDRVLGILEHYGYVDGWSVTERGELLAGVYHESDLVVAEAIVTGCFDDLDAPELAAVASVLVYEHRAPGTAAAPRTTRPAGCAPGRDEIDASCAGSQVDEDGPASPRPAAPTTASPAWPTSGARARVWRPVLEASGHRPHRRRLRPDGPPADRPRAPDRSARAPTPATRATARRAVGALERGVVRRRPRSMPTTTTRTPVTIRKGEEWGGPGAAPRRRRRRALATPRPARVVTAARRAGAPVPVLGPARRRPGPHLRRHG